MASQAVFLVAIMLSSMAVLGYTHPKQIIVGGKAHWQFGVNYTDWAAKNGPFFLNDTLVFMYDPPNATTHAHNVILFRDLHAWKECDMKKGKEVANTTQGGGEGFKYVLTTGKSYFFACGEKDGFHCNNGTMKFAVAPTTLHRCR